MSSDPLLQASVLDNRDPDVPDTYPVPYPVEPLEE